VQLARDFVEIDRVNRSHHARASRSSSAERQRDDNRDVLTNHRPPRGLATAGDISLRCPEHLGEWPERLSESLITKMSAVDA